MLLQSMTVRLGIATDKDLAQMTRHYLNKPTAIIFWVIELAIIATDIRSNRKRDCFGFTFNIPLIIGALITVFDVFLLLFIMKFGFRKIEAIVGTLIFTVLMIFVFEVYISSPNLIEILNGFVPHYQIIANHSILYIALGIIGATIMPHNLYLHSSIVQSRKYNRHSFTEKLKRLNSQQLILIFN